MSLVNFVYCTRDKYDSLTKDEGTLYFVTDTNTVVNWDDPLYSSAFIARGSEVIATSPKLAITTTIGDDENDDNSIVSAGAVRKAINTLAPVKVVSATVGSGEIPVINDSGLYYVKVVSNGTSNNTTVQLLDDQYKTNNEETPAKLVIDVVEGTLVCINNFEDNTHTQIYVLQPSHDYVFDYYNINKTTNTIENHYFLDTATLQLINELSSLHLGENQFISSRGVDDVTGIPKFKAITLGAGLKIENDVLSLDSSV